VVVNLEEEKIAVVDPKVYLIGNTVDSWDTANPETLFTVDNENEVVTITKDLKADELRMHVWFDDADWFTKPLGEGTQVSWWQVEFIVLEGKIEFRGTGGDQTRVVVEEANYTIDLNFKDGTGSITKN
jgi:starch-binding outer membrane protein SusE/F